MSVCLSLEYKLLKAGIIGGQLMPYNAIEILVDDCFFMLVVTGDVASNYILHH